MADVFGSIGNEQVELNNAATEATLKLLLQSSLTANKQSLDSIKNLAQRSGLDPDTVAQTDQNLKKVSASSAGFSTAIFSTAQALGAMAPTVNNIVDLGKKIAAGTGEASDVFNALVKLPGPFGLVAQGASVLAQFQEQQIKQYQTLTQSGVNFGGSLTDLRMAASATKMTMQEFTDFAKRNAGSLAMLGANVDEGARAFTRVSKEFQSGPFANNLRALGYTSAEMNDSLVQFMSLQGAQGLQDKKRVQEVQVATAGYLTELDKLTQLTGVEKKKLEEEQKKAEMNAAFQAKMMSLAPAEQAKLRAAYDKAAASGLKGATDLVMATALGLPPVTEASQQLTAVLPEAAAGMVDMTNTATTIGTTQRDVTQKFAGAVEGAVNGAKNLESVGGAMIMNGNKLGGVINSGIALQNKMQQQGLDTSDKIVNAYDKIGNKQATQAESEAAQAAKTQLAMKELGEKIINGLMPIVAQLLPYLNDFALGLVNVTKYFMDNKDALQSLGMAVGAVIAGFVLLKTVAAVRAAKAATRGTPGNPMVVTPTGPGLPGPGSPGAPGSPTTPGRAGGVGRAASLARGLAGGVGGLLGGLALDAATEKLKESGNEKAAAGTDIASSAAKFAGMGAMAGSIVPGLGTAIGGGVGALAGGAYGLYKNFDTLFGGQKTAMPNAQSALPTKPELPPISETAMEELKKSSASAVLADPIEKLVTQLETLNKQATEMVKLLQSTSENTRNTVSATRALKRDLFPVPG